MVPDTFSSSLNRTLGILVVVLAVAVAAFWGWRWLTRPRVSSPEELAQAVLTAATPREREIAAVRLSQCDQPSQEERRRASQALVQVLEESKQPEVRVACLRGIGQNWDYHRIDKLFELMDDHSLPVRAQAGTSLQNMLRGKCPFKADDPREKRLAAIRQLQELWEREKRSATFRAFIRERMGEDL